MPTESFVELADVAEEPAREYARAVLGHRTAVAADGEVDDATDQLPAGYDFFAA